MQNISYFFIFLLFYSPNYFFQINKLRLCSFTNLSLSLYSIFFDHLETLELRGFQRFQKTYKNICRIVFYHLMDFKFMGCKK